MISKLIKKIFLHQENVLVDINLIKAQLRYFSKLPEHPMSDLERSLLQYKCQNYLRNRFTLFIVNVFALFLLLVILPMLTTCVLIFSWRKSKGKSKTEIYCAWNVTDDLISSSYDKLEFVDKLALYDIFRSIRVFDVYFILSVLLKSKVRGLFTLKIAYKIFNYRCIIEKYAPKGIIVTSEYSYTSSIMTSYCELLFIEHVNVMHGEKLFNIRDSYFRFSKCWVWSEHYIELFESLRSDLSHFDVYNPFLNYCSLSPVKPKRLVYYLQGETSEEIAFLRDTISKIKGYVIAFRPHPRYTELQQLKDILADIEIEKDIGIKESLAQASLVCSKYSTVLQIAEANGIEILVDDLSCRQQYKALCFYNYKYTNERYMKMSQIVRTTKSENSN